MPIKGGADPPQAEGQTRAGLRWRQLDAARDLACPKGPKVYGPGAEGDTVLRPATIGFMAAITVPRARGIGLLERWSIPPIAFSRHCSSRVNAPGATGED